MRKLLTCAAFAAVMAVGMAQQTSTVVRTPDGDIATFVNTNNLSYEDAAAAFAIAHSLNMDPAAVLAMRGSINAPFYQLAPAYEIAQVSGRPLSDIWNLYSNGMTWMQIANQYNVPATYYDPLAIDTTGWSNDMFTQGVWQSMLQNNYAMVPDDFTYFSSNNVPMNEVVVGEVLARQDNLPVRDVISAYNANSSWPDLQNHYASITTTTPLASQTTTTTTQTTTAVTTPPVETETETTVDTLRVAHHTQTAPASPIMEWQVNGGNIRPYNGNYAFTSSRYTMHRAVRRHRYHRRVSRKNCR